MSDADAIGFIGLGAMGGAVARRLGAAGHRLVVFDSRPEATAALAAAGATVAESSRAVADSSATVFVSLPTPAIVEEVALGPNGLIGGAAIETYVDLSTTGPIVAERIGEALSGARVLTVDAPVSGGPKGAHDGTLTVMAAGDRRAVERVRPLLDTFAGHVFVVGERPGQGQAAKVINNLMSACAIAITAEAMVLGVRSGLDPQTLLDVVHVSSGASNAASDKFPKQVLTRRFDHGFRLELMAKDVRLALEQARRLHVPMMLGATVSELWNLADGSMHGADCTAIVRMFEEWGHATIAAADPTGDAGAQR